MITTSTRRERNLGSLPVPNGDEWKYSFGDDWASSFRDEDSPKLLDSPELTDQRRAKIDDVQFIMPDLFRLADNVISEHNLNPFSSIISDEFSARNVSLFLFDVLKTCPSPISSIFFIKPPKSERYRLHRSDGSVDVPSRFLVGMRELCRKGFNNHMVGQRPLIVTEWLMQGVGVGNLIHTLQYINPKIDITVAALDNDCDYDAPKWNQKVPIIDSGAQGAGEILYYSDVRGTDCDLKRAPGVPGNFLGKANMPIKADRSCDLEFSRALFVSLSEYYLSSRDM